MIQIQDENINIMYSENIPYTRVDLSGFLTFVQYKEKLSNQKLFDLIEEKGVENILLNHSSLWRVGTEDLDWIEKEWFSKASAAGIKRVSLVFSQQVFDLMTNLFQTIAIRVNTGSLEVRFFYDAQFYDGWESVNWLYQHGN
jgi:hypothetical protein